MPASAARRSLPTAVAAGALLAGLWFVPTTHPTADLMTPAATARSSAPAHHGSVASTASATSAATVTGARSEARAVHGGRVDTTPYLVGGVLALGLGAAAAYAMRRTRTPST